MKLKKLIIKIILKIIAQFPDKVCPGGIECLLSPLGICQCEG